MTPYWESEGVTLHVGDCRKVLAGMADASVDAIVTDPPYELGFMGRAWDASGIAYDVDMWRQCWRVLKPGGHLAAFGGTRTYHRMTVAIEDAGFEIRDSLHWIYGSGFPKGQDIARSIDRRRDDRAQVLQVTAWLASARDAAGWTNRMLNDAFGHRGDRCSHWTTQGKAACVPSSEQWDRLRELLDFDDTGILPLVAHLNSRKGLLGEAWAEREVVGQGHRVRRESDVQVAAISVGAYDLTAPASEAAQTWQGWNTSLKPAHEPIVLARKSTGFESTVANVLLHGTGALNIAACRVEPTGESKPRDGEASQERRYSAGGNDGFAALPGVRGGDPAGRWPANVVFSHSQSCGEACEADCPVGQLDRQSGQRSSGLMRAGTTRGNRDGWAGPMPEATGAETYGDTGGASRFFPTFRYQAKAPASERPRLDDGTAHNTVKPVALMRWLVRLVTPPGGTVLDPFAGSGATAEACLVEGFRCVLVEREQPHAELIKRRLSKPIALDLFGGAS